MISGVFGSVVLLLMIHSSIVGNNNYELMMQVHSRGLFIPRFSCYFSKYTLFYIIQKTE